MIKVLTFLVTLTAFLSAETYTLKSGWNLIGFSSEKSIQTILKNREVERAVYYKNGEWFDSGTVSATQGVWVYSRSDSELEISESLQSSSERIDKIELNSGWNLLSLPVKTAVHPKLFDGKIWKYSDGEWESFGGSGNFPEIDVIGYGDGFWVYSETAKTVNISDRESEMENFSSINEVEKYLDTVVSSTVNPYPMMRVGVLESVPDSAMADDSTSSAGVDDATTTNTQEADVDEADIIKHDGKTVFYLPKNGENSILFTTFQKLLSGDNQPAGKIDTESRPSELYLVDNKLIAIYPQNRNFWGCWEDFSNSTWTGESHIEIYDVSDISDIERVGTHRFSGNFVDSRVTGGKLYLVSRFLPTVDVSYQKEYCKESQYCWYSDENGSFKYDYSKPIYGEKRLLPKIDGENFIEPERLYAPLKLDHHGFITSIHSFNISDFKKQKHISFVGDSSTLYASNSSIYLTSSSYPLYFGWNSWNQREAIYKISLEDMSFRGKGFVDGRILNQFSLSESGETLRIATTVGWSWGREDTDNIVTALQESEKELQIVSEIRGLGEEGETIKGVRFLGDRGYIVTFRTTDPLYVVDFSDPKKPVLGKNPLKIDGYSTYFHPISSEKILSVGVDADSEGRENGFQIQLFNIADLDNPKLLDKVRFPDGMDSSNRWRYYSESVYNHKAFTYRASDKLFGVTVQHSYDKPISRDEYIAKHYTLITEELLKNCGNEKLLNGEFDFSKNSYYTYNWNAERCDIYNLMAEDYLYISETETARENYMSLYRVEDSGINSVDEVVHTNEDYGDSRGVIFSFEGRDYLLYYSGGVLNLQEVK
jgi:uncharacterized secreted protein with C-terminal beta-propeller domain